MERGYVKIPRSILNNQLWDTEPFSKSQAWIDLLLNARLKTGKLAVNGCIINIDRGQIGWPEITMSKRWSWSRNKVRRFLKMLDGEGSIVQQKGNKTTIITICNYDDYAADEEFGR